jgi:serine phosphatase RsbU (regulator of sigma subunit)/anti-sigma regulatory factor (Ser/Thr protein kinase)/anti-anti-sigma regulatory factor
VLPGTAHDDDTLDRMVGYAGVVRDAFEQLPMLVAALDGPDHRLSAMNAAYRTFTGHPDVMGLPYRDAFPGPAGQPLHDMLDRVYATGQPESRTERRAQIGLVGLVPETPVGLDEVYADFTVIPQRDTDGAVNGLLVIANDVTDRVAQRRTAQQQTAQQQTAQQQTAQQQTAQQQTAEQRAAPAERKPARGAAEGPARGREIVADLQRALLPTALPVLPRARIAARYLVAGQEQSAGGDWFDAIPLADGTVALVVGDVVGHGVTAAAAMGQLRAVMTEHLATETDLGRILACADAFAARTPALRAATLALAVLDPVSGKMRYTTCGHPPPLVISVDGAARYLEGTGTGPLGTGSPPVLATSALAPGELVVLYSDGLVERPDMTIAEGMAELAVAAAGALAESPGGSLAGSPGEEPGERAQAPATPERVCQRTVERLTRTGRADDITVLAAQRLAVPVPPLHLELPNERPSLTAARDAFAWWLSRLGAAADDWEALHLALVEVFTNAIEHAYPRGEPGTIELEATLCDDGNVECRVIDHGSWQPPDLADADRGHGLMVAGQVIDSLLVSHSPLRHPTRAAGGPARPPGTIVTLRHRLGRPAVLASAHDEEHATQSAGPPFTVDTSMAESATARALVHGPVDITTADQLARRLLSVSRGGTVPLVADLTGVTQLASAGVRALYAVSGQMAAHGQDLTLITAPGSAAHLVLDLVRLAHIAGDGL